MPRDSKINRDAQDTARRIVSAVIGRQPGEPRRDTILAVARMIEGARQRAIAEHRMTAEGLAMRGHGLERLLP